MTKEEKIQLYNQVLELRCQTGWGRYRLAQATGATPNQVRKWINGKGFAIQVRHHPDLNPSPDLGYLLGVIYGDGTLTNVDNEDYRICLNATDRDFVERFAQALARVLNRKPIPIRSFREQGNGKTRYRAYAASYLLYQWANQPLYKHKELLNKYPREFLRGFFDSEGTIRIRKHQSTISLSNTKQELIALCSKLLNNLGIKCKTYTSEKTNSKWRTEHILYISGQREVKNFITAIGSSVQRKNKKFEKALASITLTKPCALCGNEFEPYRPKRDRYCHVCRPIAYRRRQHQWYIKKKGEAK